VVRLGTMILCNKKLNPIPYNTGNICTTGCDLTMISIAVNKQGSERIAIASFYKPPDVSFSYRKWYKLFEEIQSLFAVRWIL